MNKISVNLEEDEYNELIRIFQDNEYPSITFTANMLLLDALEQSKYSDRLSLILGELLPSALEDAMWDFESNVFNAALRLTPRIEKSLIKGAALVTKASSGLLRHAISLSLRLYEKHSERLALQQFTCGSDTDG
ncbi:MAG: hypothetical protein IJ125_02705 [Atopobiaceae bacterium]|nr:hypothetical protein [Atopobiaceae bacterium]